MELRDIQEFLKTCKSYPLWQKVGISHHHGIALPLSALHSQKSSGIGEFLDLLPLIDWAEEVGMEIVQLLPLNDTLHEPSPYFAISSCALNPIYLSLYSIDCKDKALKKELLALQEMTSLDRIPYSTIYTKKMKWLRKYFLLQKKEIAQDTLLQNFVKSHPFLPPYALFLLLGEKEKTFDWRKWPSSLQNLSKEKMDALLDQNKEELLFPYFLQYLAFSQMHIVKEYAAKKNIQILGDLPILISPHSADVFWHRSLFDLEYSAGAPPDNFNLKGQKWNFPLFNWESMKKDHFSWWKERLSVASEFYHLYRIDHIVGFFRIWAIPHDKKAGSGFFLPKDRSVWKKEGEEHLSLLLQLSSILPIGEDLGLIPQETFDTLKKLGICGTRVMRWFLHKKPQEYDPLSITTLSTHDTETLQEWWKNHPNDTHLVAQEKHWVYAPKLTFEQRKSLLFDAHHTSSLFHINLLQEYLALFDELVWDSFEKERINIPGKIRKSNWGYRFRPSLEEMVRHEGFKKSVKEILS